MPLEFDLHINSSGQIELHERIHGLLGGFQNVEQALVGSDFELLPRFLVHMRRSEHTIFVDPGRKGNRTRDAFSGPANGFDPWRNFAGQCLTIPGLDPRPAAPAAGLAL